MLGRTDRRLRMVALLVVFAVFGSATMLRLGYWQVVAAPDLVDKAIDTMAPPPRLALARAEIVDRDGVTLAQSATFDRLDANPRDIPAERRADIVATLTEILDLGPAEQAAYLAKLSSGAAWDWLARRLSPEQSVEIALAKDEGKLPGVTLAPVESRVYPRDGGQSGTSLASHLLGFVAGDSGGAYGVERLYESRLTGTDGRSVDVASIAGAAAAAGDVTLADLDGLQAPPLRLTIDARLQRQVEIELNAARLANDAKSASAIVMDPYTGAILASASVPAFDANDYGTVAQEDPGLLRDRVISGIYEPGSVMKAFTVTAALESGAVTPQTKILDQPRLAVQGGEVRNSGESIGLAPVKDIIARSRNVGTSKIAFRMAPRDHQKAAHILFDMWERVGMVGKTGVDMAGEEAGIWYDPDRYTWAEMDLANRSFGQGVGVTLMHLATGYATLVNGGFRVQPHVVADGETATVRQGARGQREGGRPGPRAPRLRHRIGTQLRPRRAHPRLHDRWQDRHRPDLGPLHRPERRLEAQPLQPQLRGLRRREPPGGAHRHPHRGGRPQGHQALPGPQHRVLRAVPDDRARGHQEPRHQALPRSLRGLADPGHRCCQGAHVRARAAGRQGACQARRPAARRATGRSARRAEAQRATIGRARMSSSPWSREPAGETTKGARVDPRRPRPRRSIRRQRRATSVPRRSAERRHAPVATASRAPLTSTPDGVSMACHE